MPEPPRIRDLLPFFLKYILVSYDGGRLQTLEEVVIEHNVKLIIVDSVWNIVIVCASMHLFVRCCSSRPHIVYQEQMASLVRKEYDGKVSVRDRNDMLSAEAALLKYLAEGFDIPVCTRGSGGEEGVCAR